MDSVVEKIDFDKEKFSDKKKAKKLQRKSIAGRLYSTEDYIFCIRNDIQLTPFIDIDDDRPWGHDKSFLVSRDLRDFIVSTTKFCIPDSFICVRNSVALRGIVVIAVSNLQLDHLTAEQCLSSCVTINTRCTRKFFSDKFISYFNFGKILRLKDSVFSTLKLHDSLLFVPNSETMFGARKSKKRKAEQRSTLYSLHDEINGQLPNANYYILSETQLLKNNYPLESNIFITNDEIILNEQSDVEFNCANYQKKINKEANLLSIDKSLKILNQFHSYRKFGYVSTIAKSLDAKKCEKYTDKQSSTPALYGLDCEMCMTSEGLTLCRVTIVNQQYQVVLDEYVKPEKDVIDYMTKWSGIDAETLKNVSTRLCQIQVAVISLIDESDIIVGHSLENDLRALRVIHKKCVDTAVLFSSPPNEKKSSLKVLAKLYLQKTIQDGTKGHNSAEDAITALELAQLKTSIIISEHLNDTLRSISLQAKVLSDQQEDFHVRAYSSLDPLNNRPPIGLVWGDVDITQLKICNDTSDKFLSTENSAKNEEKDLQYLEQELLCLSQSLPKHMLLLVVAQADGSHIQKIKNQRKACKDPRAISAWTKEKEENLNQMEKIFGDCYVLMKVTN